MAAADPRTRLLLAQLERAFDRRSWHGANLMGSLRRLSPEAAAWRPGPGRHNAWEVAVHAAYWKYRLCRLLAADPPTAFSIAGSDWFERPEATSGAAWKQDLALLRDWHGRLTDAVVAFDPDRLEEPATSEWSFLDLIAGGAAHDLYHAGQIMLLRRMRAGS